VTERPLAVCLDLLPLVGSPTGVGVFCEHLVAALVERPELQVSGYAVGLRSAESRLRVPDGVPVRTWPLPARLVHMAWEYSSHPSAERVAGRVDVVHGTNFVVPPARTAACVVTVHDLTAVRFPELCAPASLAYPTLVRRAIERGAFVHTHSASVAAEVIELLDAPADHVRVVPPGIPPAVAPSVPPADAAGSPAAPEAGSPAAPEPRGEPLVSGPFVLALGTIEPRKDHPTLVRAFAKAAAGVPGLRLVVAGADGWGTPAFDEAVAHSGVGDRIVRLGYVSPAQRASLLRDALVMAYPSVYEGFGFPPLEAMAAGVPVVSTDAGSLAEVIGGAALVVPVGDDDALAAALAEVVTDPAMRAGLIERGRERVTHYSWAATAAAMSSLYADAAADRRLRGPDRR
jgi:glycosyltransferase involved in cell wall biosynthesis